MENEKRRNPTFDIMKGVAMLVVIMSHTHLPWVGTHTFAFWRSALFFIISGYFAKEWGFCEFWQKGGGRLLIPYFFTFAIMLPFAYLGDVIFNSEVFKTGVISMLLGSSSFTKPVWGVYANCGPMWFIFALMWVRLYWSLLNKIKSDIVLGCVVAVFGIFACNLKFYITFPFSILSSFGALGFFFAGHLVRKYDLLKSENGCKIIPICLLCLVYCIYFSKLDINYCQYGAYYVVDVLACLGGFFILYSTIEKFGDIQYKFWKFLNFIGRYSLVAFCLHSIDQCLNIHWLPFKFWDCFNPGIEIIIGFLLRVSFVFAGAYLVSKSNFLKKKIFFIK